MQIQFFSQVENSLILNCLGFSILTLLHPLAFSPCELTYSKSAYGSGRTCLAIPAKLLVGV
jgi:hypothetical protein